MAEWIDAGVEDELPEGSRRLVRSAGHEIALFHVQQRYYALNDSCPHQGSSLVVGKIEGATVTCRAHGLRFPLATGCMRSSVPLCVRTYPTRVHDGRVQIEIATDD